MQQPVVGLDGFTSSDVWSSHWVPVDLILTLATGLAGGFKFRRYIIHVIIKTRENTICQSIYYVLDLPELKK